MFWVADVELDVVTVVAMVVVTVDIIFVVGIGSKHQKTKYIFLSYESCYILLEKIFETNFLQLPIWLESKAIGLNIGDVNGSSISSCEPPVP